VRAGFWQMGLFHAGLFVASGGGGIDRKKGHDLDKFSIVQYLICGCLGWGDLEGDHIFRICLLSCGVRMRKSEVVE